MADYTITSQQQFNAVRPDDNITLDSTTPSLSIVDDSGNIDMGTVNYLSVEEGREAITAVSGFTSNQYIKDFSYSFIGRRNGFVCLIENSKYNVIIEHIINSNTFCINYLNADESINEEIIVDASDFDVEKWHLYRIDCDGNVSIDGVVLATLENKPVSFNSSSIEVTLRDGDFYYVRLQNGLVYKTIHAATDNLPSQATVVSGQIVLNNLPETFTKDLGTLTFNNNYSNTFTLNRNINVWGYLGNTTTTLNNVTAVDGHYANVYANISTLGTTFFDTNYYYYCNNLRAIRTWVETTIKCYKNISSIIEVSYGNNLNFVSSFVNSRIDLLTSNATNTLPENVFVNDSKWNNIVIKNTSDSIFENRPININALDSSAALTINRTVNFNLTNLNNNTGHDINTNIQNANTNFTGVLNSSFKVKNIVFAATPTPLSSPASLEFTASFSEDVILPIYSTYYNYSLVVYGSSHVTMDKSVTCRLVADASENQPTFVPIELIYFALKTNTKLSISNLSDFYIDENSYLIGLSGTTQLECQLYDTRGVYRFATVSSALTSYYISPFNIVFDKSFSAAGIWNLYHGQNNIINIDQGNIEDTVELFKLCNLRIYSTIKTGSFNVVSNDGVLYVNSINSSGEIISEVNFLTTNEVHFIGNNPSLTFSGTNKKIMAKLDPLYPATGTFTITNSQTGLDYINRSLGIEINGVPIALKFVNNDSGLYSVTTGFNWDLSGINSFELDKNIELTNLNSHNNLINLKFTSLASGKISISSVYGTFNLQDDETFIFNWITLGKYTIQNSTKKINCNYLQLGYQNSTYSGDSKSIYTVVAKNLVGFTNSPPNVDRYFLINTSTKSLTGMKINCPVVFTDSGTVTLTNTSIHSIINNTGNTVNITGTIDTLLGMELASGAFALSNIPPITETNLYILDGVTSVTLNEVYTSRRFENWSNIDIGTVHLLNGAEIYGTGNVIADIQDRTASVTVLGHVKIGGKVGMVKVTNHANITLTSHLLLTSTNVSNYAVTVTTNDYHIIQSDSTAVLTDNRTFTSAENETINLITWWYDRDPTDTTTPCVWNFTDNKTGGTLTIDHGAIQNIFGVDFDNRIETHWSANAKNSHLSLTGAGYTEVVGDSLLGSFLISEEIIFLNQDNTIWTPPKFQGEFYTAKKGVLSTNVQMTYSQQKGVVQHAGNV
jgi:hypothetical protein